MAPLPGMKIAFQDIADPQLRALIGPGSPFELTVNSAGLPAFRGAPRDLSALYRQARNRAAARDSEVLIVGSRRITLRRIFSNADAIRQALGENRSSAHARRVAILLSDAADSMSAFIAVTEMGDSAVLIPACGKAESVSGYLETSNPAVLIVDCDSDLPTYRERNAVVTVRWPLPEKNHPPDGKAPETFLPQPAREIHASDEAVVAFTSGSSGRPKGVRLSHEGIISGLWNMMLSGAWVTRLNGPDRGHSAARRHGAPGATLLVGSMTHVSGYTQLLLRLISPGRLVLVDSWNADEVRKAVIREKATTISGITPAMITELRSGTSGEEKLPIETFNIFGHGLDAHEINGIRSAFPGTRIGVGYGMTETNGAIATSHGSELLNFPGSVGRVVPSVQLKVTDGNGAELPSGAVGRIHVRGSMLMLGYCHEGSITDPPSGRWYFTGDLGYRTETGHLTIVDRASNSGEIRGTLVYAAAIESQIRAWGEADDCAALVLAHDATILVWIVKPSMHRPASESLAVRLAARLGVPTSCLRVIPVEEIPRTSSGKTDRQALRATLKPSSIRTEC